MSNPNLQSLPPLPIDQLRKSPAHEVLIELSRAAQEAKLLHSPEFRKLVSYLLELADGRDRREPWVTRPGNARPIPKLRVALESCFGMYADLHWFRLNKTANSSGQALTGLFPRMAANLWRVSDVDFAALVTALLGQAPDAAMLRLLQERNGKIKGLGIEAFSRLAYAYRRDLFFVIPKPWGESSGCLKYLDNDLRKYCGLSRNLRAVADELGVAAEIRGAVFNLLLSKPKPPQQLLEALHKAIGPSIAKFSTLESSDAYEPSGGTNDPDTLPMEHAASAIRARRGRRTLRETLMKSQGEKCAITGACLKELLEVAYVVPFPTGEVHAPSNALLMRSDLHTLWDLNLIGIEPRTRRVYSAPRLTGSTYERLAGRTVSMAAGAARPSMEGLRERWRMFVNAHPSSAESKVAAPAQDTTTQTFSDRSDRRHEGFPDRAATTTSPDLPIVTRNDESGVITRS